MGEREQDGPEYARKEVGPDSSKLPLSAQNKLIAELHETIGLLKQSLHLALRPEIDKEQPGEDRAAALQSPLADLISDNNVSIRHATNKINDLVNRVEL